MIAPRHSRKGGNPVSRPEFSLKNELDSRIRGRAESLQLQRLYESGLHLAGDDEA